MNEATTKISMREEDWTSLVFSIEQGNCVLMLGPDAVTVTYQGKRMPVLVGLARFVREKLGPGFSDLDASNPSAVAQVAVVQEDHFTLQGWVQEFYDNLDATSSVLDDLAAIPFRLVISTSSVLGVDHAFSSRKPKTHVDYYDRTAPAQPSFPDPSADAPVVYNLYGSLTRPASLILSDSDRLDFLVSVISDNPPLPAKLKSTLRDPKRTFLFLGFRLHQWQLRVLLHMLAENARREFKSFAVELDRTDLDTETKLFYKTGHKIQFHDVDLEQFTRELRGRVRAPERVNRGDAEAGSIVAPDAPVVFLCHASDDKEFADRLAVDLRRNGISTWLDREDLRGGDRWDPLIRRTIEDEVEYVVVIQSANLRKKDVGYVNREINLALDRQQEYRDPRRFLIPITIDGPESLLPHLDHLQSIDLSYEGGVDDLVKAINRDLNWAARRL